MRSYYDIFPEALGVRSTGEINGTVLDALKEDPAGPTDEELIGAFHHVFETAGKRAPREVEIFLANVPVLNLRIRKHAQAFVAANQTNKATALTSLAWAMRNAADALKPKVPLLTYDEIFPESFEGKSLFEITERIYSALETGPGSYSNLEMIAAFQHVFETAEGRSQRELYAFLTAIYALTRRVGDEVAKGEPDDFDKGRQRIMAAAKMMKLAMDVEKTL
jgi:hypothetical protein